MGYRAGVAAVVAAAVLWSLMPLVVRGIETAGTLEIVLYRSLGLLPVLFAFLAWRTGGRPFAAIRAAGLPAVAGGLALTVAFLGAIAALRLTTVASAVFLFAASPILAALLARAVLGEPVGGRRLAAIALALAGILAMVGEGLGSGALAGNLAALASAAGFATFAVILRRGRAGEMLPAVLWGGLFSAVLSAGLLAAEGALAPPAAGDVARAAGMGAGLLGLGMALYTLGSRVLPAADAALLTMVEVILGPVWVWLLLGEGAGPATLAGGGMVLAAVAFNAAAGMARGHEAPPLPGPGTGRR